MEYTAREKLVILQHEQNTFVLGLLAKNDALVIGNIKLLEELTVAENEIKKLMRKIEVSAK